MSRQSIYRIAGSLLLLLPALAAAQPPRDPVSLFPWEATVETPGRGLVRLVLPQDVLEQVRPDLSDLRLFDAEGVERPYLVDSGRRPPRETQPVDVLPSSVDRRIERADSLAPIFREHLTLSPPAQRPGERWTLLLDTASRDFVRRVVVYRIDPEPDGQDPAAETDARGHPIAEGTLFRMQDPLRERLGIELPPVAVGVRLEVRVTGEGGYIEPTVRLLAERARPSSITLSVPLQEISRVSHDGTTTVELDRPPGLVVDRLVLGSSGGHFFREVRVFDQPRGSAPREIGRAAIFRVVELDGAAQLVVGLRRARGTRLRVEIDDGDSPPLEQLSVVAQITQPSLLFESGFGAMTLRCGGGRVRAPDYDVGNLAGTRLGDRLVEREVPEAGVSPLRENPRFDDSPALAFALHPGREPAAETFTHVAPLTVAGASEGLSRVRLPASVLAAARADLADLRIVDAEGRQWPYLRTADESDWVDAQISEPSVADRASSYRITLPVSAATVDRIRLDSAATFVSRQYEIFQIDAQGRRVPMFSGALTREPNARQSLEIHPLPQRVTGLDLRVVDGSEAPLVFSAAQVSIPSPTLYLAAPDGEYRVLVGAVELSPPEYEIGEARELVLAVRSVDASVGDAAANPAHVSPPWYQAPQAYTWLVWLVLILAILVLGALTLRVARHPEEPASAAPEDGTEDAEPAEPSEPAEEELTEQAQPEGGPTEF